MKKKTSPISLSNLYFTDYTWLKLALPTFDPKDLTYDHRRDFIIDQNFAGVAAELIFFNTQHNAWNGIRRKVSLLLFDATDRVLIHSRQMTLSMKKGDMHARIWMKLPYDEIDFRSGHTFRLQVRDDNAGQIVGEGCFHTYTVTQYGDPMKWYDAQAAGLVPYGESKILKSCDASSRENKIYRIRFEVTDNIPTPRPDVMPEMEVRLYRPDGGIEVDFIEPRPACRGDLTYIVERSFNAKDPCIGVYYAELLCLDTAVAGFVFVIDRDVEGSWTGEGLYILDEYDYAAACRRYNESQPEEEAEDDSSDYFNRLLDDFIASQNSGSEDDYDNSDNSDDSDDSDNSDNSDNSDDSDNSDNSDDNDDNDEDPLSDLDGLTGLQSVKEKIRVYKSVMDFCMLRAENSLEMFHAPLHAMFLGSPGTGKTTVAKLMGRMLKKTGILSSGHVVVKERSTLIGQYYSSEAEKTIEAIEQAQGGILFIDEAHSLFQPNDPKDPGKFVIEALLTALADPAKDDWMLILAGYPEGMKRLFELNPGFKSRIPDSNIYTFEDFSEAELMEIAERRLETLEFTLSPDAREALRVRLASDYASRDHTFGNARHVMNLLHTEILPAMAVRVMASGLTDEHSLSEIQASDIPMPLSKAMPRRKPVGFSFPTAS